MSSAKPYLIYPAFAFLAYPNRDSTPFKKFYNIPEAQTVLRGTLRYQGFTNFVKVLVDVGLLDDTKQTYLQNNSPDIIWVNKYISIFFLLFLFIINIEFISFM